MLIWFSESLQDVRVSTICKGANGTTYGRQYPDEVYYERQGFCLLRVGFRFVAAASPSFKVPCVRAIQTACKAADDADYKPYPHYATAMADRRSASLLAGVADLFRAPLIG